MSDDTLHSLLLASLRRESLPMTTCKPCHLLEKLAPETRTIIYEYVLSFDTPIKHVKKLQPFLGKLNAPEQKPSGQSIYVAAWKTTGEDSRDSDEPIQRVNTSILTVSKLIYLEAIATFYANNTLSIDPTSLKCGKITSPLSTDLSLATNVVVKCNTVGVQDKVALSQLLTDTWMLIGVTFPAVFPNLRKGSVHVLTKPGSLFAHRQHMPKLFENIHFVGVGSIVGTSKQQPCVDYFVQSKSIMESWANHTNDVPNQVMNPWTVSARLLYRLSRTDPDEAYLQYAKTLFDIYGDLVTVGYFGTIEQDSVEFSTVVEAALMLVQSIPR